MDCVEARALISAGTNPGTNPGQSPALGFHLSGCPACRAFRRIDLFDREQARRARLTDTPTEIVATTSLQIPLPAIKPVARKKSRFTLLYAGAGLVLIVCTWLAWYVGLPMLHAWQDLGTMASLAPIQQPVTNIVDQESTSEVPPTQIAQTAVPTRLVTLVTTTTPRQTATSVRTVTPRPSNSPTPTSEPTATMTALPTETPIIPTETPIIPTETPIIPTVTPVIPTATPEPAPPVQAVAPATAPGGVTVLLMGIDARPGETTGRSDALLIVHVDPQQQTAAILSLPRDLWVAIPGIGEGKINGAIAQGGTGTAVATVSQALGIAIDHAVVIDFAGFRSLIDALDGVTVNVPRELYDPKFPTDDYGYTEAHFLAGPQRMNGTQALMYSRIRHPDSDFQRMRRQQALLIGISERLRTLGVFQSMHEADRITGALVPYVKTSMERSTVVQLLWDLRSVNPARLRQLVLDGAMIQETNIGGGYAILADAATLQSLGAQLIAP